MELAESRCPQIAGIRRRDAASDKKQDGRNRFGRWDAICLLANWRPTFCSTLDTFSFSTFFVPARDFFFLYGAPVMPTELLHRGWRCPAGLDRSEEPMLGTILIILLILLLVGALPTWPYSLLSRRRHRSHSDHRAGAGPGRTHLAAVSILARHCEHQRSNPKAWQRLDCFVACSAFKDDEPAKNDAQRISLIHSSSESTVTPNFCASVSFEPAPGPATT
jgi:hypothetical protein